MAKRYKIRELEALYPDFEERLVRVVNNHNPIGQKVAAEVFGVSQPSICNFLAERGYKRIVRYEKKERAS